MPEVVTGEENGQTAYDRLTGRLTQQWYANTTEARRAIDRALEDLGLSREDLANGTSLSQVFNECVNARGSGKSHPPRDDMAQREGKQFRGGRKRRARY